MFKAAKDFDTYDVMTGRGVPSSSQGGVNASTRCS